jgi:hypothetical protein
MWAGEEGGGEGEGEGGRKRGIDGKIFDKEMRLSTSALGKEF